MNRQTELDMRAVEFRADGSPVRYEVVHQPQAQMPRVIGGDDAPIVAPVMPERVVRAQSVVTGDWSDRARAFNLSTLNLSIVTGGLAIVAALVFGASFSLWSLLAYFFGGFALAWLIAYLLHTFVSAEGSQFLETIFLWRFLANEQRHRHSRYDAPQRSAPAWLEPVLLAGAVGFTVLFLAIIIIGVAVEQMPK